MSNELTPADIRACTGGGNDFGFGGNGAWWIIILFLFAFVGWGGNGMGGGGVQNDYVLASDFATIQRQLSDGFNSIDNALDRQNAGICDLGYTQAQLINNVGMNIMQTGNAIQTQLADCCCKTQTAIGDVKYSNAMNTNTLSREVERGFCDTNFNVQTQHNQTMQAIDKVGDRIIDWLAADKAQALRDENQALRLAASQAAQNNYLIGQLKQPCPIPAYTVPNPNCCYNNGGCGNF